MLRQRRVGETNLNAPAEIPLSHQARIVRHAEAENLSHETLQSTRKQIHADVELAFCYVSESTLSRISYVA